MSGGKIGPKGPALRPEALGPAEPSSNSDSTDGAAIPRLVGYRWHPETLEAVTTRFGIDSPVATLREATTIDDGNRYLDSQELTTAAQKVQAMALRGYRWSPGVLQAVLSGANIKDAQALLVRAVQRDNGNQYLARDELEAAARELSTTPELAYVCDLDKTVIPEHDDVLPAAPYPGIRSLLHELKSARGPDRVSGYYVTARDPDHMAGIPQWLQEKGLPSGPVDGGVSWDDLVAQREKVKDISALIDSQPGRKFVLFGDTSHKDPEVYSTIVNKYPDRITAAFIHDVRDVDASRVANLTLVKNYAEAAAILLDKGVIDEAAARRIMRAAKTDGLAISDAEIDALMRSSN